MSFEGAQAQSPSYVAPSEAPTARSVVRRISEAWTRRDTWLLFGACVCALLLYFWRLDQPTRYIYDEVYHAYTAGKLAEGNPDPYNPFAKVPQKDKEELKVAYVWDHPALAKLPMQVGIVLFGNNPFGWRFANAVFGTIGIGIMFVLARTMFGRSVAIIATLLLLLDGLWFVESRLALNDIYLVCFLLLSYLALYLYLTAPLERRWRWLWLTGFALGLAIATKWSAMYSIGGIGLVAGVREAWLGFSRIRARPGPAVLALIGSLAVLLGAFVVLPAALYVGGYVQYFAMGFDWSNFRELQWQMWNYHTTLKACHYAASPWWSWPLMLRPVWYHLYIMGNPLSFWLYLPAALGVSVLWVRGRFRNIALGVVLLGFFGQWLPWGLSPRVAYLYHFLPSVPFGCLALGYILARINVRNWRIRSRWTLRGATLVRSYLGIVLLGFVFFYPLYTWLPVSEAPILPLSRISTALPDLNFTQLHFWLPTWVPGSAWAYGCPSSTFTLLDLLPGRK